MGNQVSHARDVLGTISFSLPSSMIEQVELIQKDLGFDSRSKVLRLLIGEAIRERRGLMISKDLITKSITIEFGIEDAKKLFTETGDLTLKKYPTIEKLINEIARTLNLEGS